MSNEALRKAVERIDATELMPATPSPEAPAVLLIDPRDYDTIRQAMRDQESEIATRRANYNALVIRLGDVTTRLEAAEGLLSEAMAHMRNHRPTAFSSLLADQIDTHLKAADHG